VIGAAWTASGVEACADPAPARPATAGNALRRAPTFWFVARSTAPILVIVILLLLPSPILLWPAAPVSAGPATTAGARALAAAAASLTDGRGPASGHPMGCDLGAASASCVPASVHRQNGSGGNGSGNGTGNGTGGGGGTIGMGNGGGGWNATGNRSAGIGSGWTNITNWSYGPSPGNLGDGGITYDPPDRSVLLADGLLDSSPTSNAATESTWNYSDGNWTELGLSGNYSQPSARWGIELGMTYDAADGYVVLFGGEGGSNDTWTFSGGNWTEVFPTVSPPARTWPSLTYDAADGYVLLFGGATSQSSGYLNDAWSYLHGNWTQIANNGTQAWPSARRGANLQYDPADGYVLLFGGETNFTMSNETWTYLGGLWTELYPTNSPVPRFVAGMTFVVRYNYMLLFGGCTAFAGCVTQVNDTWAFRAGQWTELDQNFALLPHARGAVQMTWDGADGYVLLYGGAALGNHVNDTWAYNWPLDVRLRPTFDSAEVGIPFNISAEAFGGSLSYHYQFNVTNGTCTSVNATMETCRFPTPGLASVSVRANDSVGDLSNATFNLTVVPSLGVALAVNPSRSEVHLSVTFWANGTGGLATYHYAWSALPPGCPNPSSTTAVVVCTLTASGNYTTTVVLKDSLGGRTEAATNLSVLTALGVAVDSAVGDAGVALPPLFAHPSGGEAPYETVWINPPTGCLQNATGALLCVIPKEGIYAAEAAITDALGRTVRANATLTIAPFPSVSATGAPRVAVAPATIDFSAVVLGGTGTFNYTWELGDGSRSNQTALLHTYRTPGTFNVTLWANDSVGGDAMTVVSIVVVPPLSTVLASSAGNVTDAGLSVTFTVEVMGGYGPFAYTWSAMPFGCNAGSVDRVTCANLKPGVSSPIVTVRDSLGEAVAVSTNLRVDPAISAVPYAVAMTAACGVVPLEELFANVTGGTGTITESWSLGDGGSATGPSVDHSYVAAGNYSVLLNLTDSVNGSRTVSLTVSVIVTACPGPTSGVALLLSPLVLGALVAVVLVAALLAVLLTRRRRSPPAASAGEPLEYEGAPPEGPEPPSVP